MKTKTKSKIFMVRCPRCTRENYAPNVASGQCTWCRYKAKEKDIDGIKCFK